MRVIVGYGLRLMSKTTTDLKNLKYALAVITYQKQTIEKLNAEIKKLKEESNDHTDRTVGERISVNEMIMTDNEIIKALECCLSSNDLFACWKCPAVKSNICCDGSSKISNGIVNSVLDLINRQKAEIERLKSLERNVYETVEKLKNKIESEARKEFAERLKEELTDKKYKYVTETNYSKTVNSVIDSCVGSIDNLVKEMEKDK